MRPHIVLLAAILACSEHHTANQGADGGSGGGGPTVHALAVAVAGSGKVISAPAGIDCGATCSAQFAEGTVVVLAAVPGPGWTLARWSGACSGDQACSVTLIADAAVGAAFERLPPVMRRLEVVRQGQGTVTSAPAGIDCGAVCSASFSDGAQVTLAALAAAGWTFSGFSGACAGASCSVTLSADRAVTATFTENPPPPECDGLVPSSLPAPVVATLPQGPCLDGTSDDGAGNFLLGYTAGTAGSTYANYLFFAIQGGSAVHVADTVPAPGGHGSGTYVYGQPEGFTLFTTWTSPGGSWLDSYSREGVMTHSTAVVPGWDAYPPSSAIGIDPSGGTVIARHEHLAAGWRTTWQRLDAGGAPETAEVTIDTSADPVAAVGVALSGNALVILAPSPGTWRARWFASDGTAIAGWFLIQARDRPLLRSLMDGSLLLGAYHGASIVTYQGIGYMHRVLDGAEELDTLPDWLAQRHDDVFYAVRDGLAYASWGPSGPCGADSVEIVAISGTSCGCLRVPNLTGSASVGRDGSLIVPRPDAAACAYDLYPQLLR